MSHNKVLKGFIFISFLMILSGCDTFPVDGNDQDMVGETFTPMVEEPSITTAFETPQPTETPPPTVAPSIAPTVAKSPQSNEVNIPENTSDLSDYLYQVQPGSPAYLPNLFHPDEGCNWLGIGGQVFDVDGNPVGKGIVVEAGGVLEGNSFFGLSLSGLAPDYGEGGYEIVLADHGVDSRGTIWVQLSDLAGNKISPQTYVDTYKGCDKILVLLNFVPYYEETLNKYYLPYIGQEDSR